MTTYYVSASGSDANDGLQPESPKQTIQAAIDVAPEGSSIRIASGTYDEDLTSDKRGMHLVGEGVTGWGLNGGTKLAGAMTIGAEDRQVAQGWLLENIGFIGGTHGLLVKRMDYLVVRRCSFESSQSFDIKLEGGAGWVNFASLYDIQVTRSSSGESIILDRSADTTLFGGHLNGAGGVGIHKKNQARLFVYGTALLNFDTHIKISGTDCILQPRIENTGPRLQQGVGVHITDQGRRIVVGGSIQGVGVGVKSDPLSNGNRLLSPIIVGCDRTVEMRGYSEL